MANGTWKIARRGNAQLPLVIVMALAVVLVLLGKAQAGLFDRARTAHHRLDARRCWRRCMRRSSSFDRWMGSVGRTLHRLSGESARSRRRMRGCGNGTMWPW